MERDRPIQHEYRDHCIEVADGADAERRRWFLRMAKWFDWAAETIETSKAAVNETCQVLSRADDILTQDLKRQPDAPGTHGEAERLIGTHRRTLDILRPRHI